MQARRGARGAGRIDQLPENSSSPAGKFA